MRYSLKRMVEVSIVSKTTNAPFEDFVLQLDGKKR